MAGSFMQTAAKQVMDVSSFLKDAASGNGIKYKPEGGKQHRLYITFAMAEQEVDGVMQQVKSLIAMSGKVHEWSDSAGKYNATVCLDGVVRNAQDGTPLNKGGCPICKRIQDGWDIYNYRYQQEEEQCNLTGELRKKHLENSKTNFLSERKAKEATPYIYMLVAQFKTNEDGTPIMTEGTQLPAYDLKVMKLSASRVEKIQKQLKNSGVDFIGSELIFDYPAEDDKRLVVQKSTVSPVVMESARFTCMYPAVLEQINKDVQKFDWAGMESAFPEWKGMTDAEAQETMDSMFHKWDEYQQEKLINPLAKYMEYAYQLQTSNPALGATPQIPTLGNVATPNVPLPGAMGQAQQMTVPQIPTGNAPQTVAQPEQPAGAIPGMPVQTPVGSIPGMPTQQTVSEPAQQTTAGATGGSIPGMGGIPGMPKADGTADGVAMTANQLLGGQTQKFVV